MEKYENWISAQNVCVIGAGTMGAGIAAHLANLGFNVTLLDVNRETAVQSLERARQARPAHFYVPETVNNVRVGSVEENLTWVAECDWVCEAIFENMEAKRALFAALDPLLRPDSMITTNTSGLQIGLLAEGLSEGFRARFMGTHFFNPPRYLKLLELIPTAETDPTAVVAMTEFLEDRVARRVVLAKDTPGFIANRFGMWAMFHAVHTAERLHLSIEQVDAITGPFLGRPKSGSFRLNDLVGIDVMAAIGANLVERCTDDPFRNVFETPNSMMTLLSRGWIGEKSGQGYYRREGRELLALDLQTLAYRQKQDVILPSLSELAGLPLGQRIAAALDLRDEAGEFLRTHLVPVLKYADYLKSEISHSVVDFDRVMMWGFGWELGPFGLIDAIGAAKAGIASKPFYEGGSALGLDGKYTAIKPDSRYKTLADYEVIGTGDSFLLRDLGDGVTAISLSTKMGVITTRLVAEVTELLMEAKLRRIVLTSEAKSFSAGFDLNFFQTAISAGHFELIESELLALQNLGALLEKTHSVAAVCGYCLGAGLELAMSCQRIAAQAESQIGLPEVKVGLLPGGRGTALMRLNNQATAKRLAEVAAYMTEGTISQNADHARSLGYLRPTDVTIYHPDRLIQDAKMLALAVGVDERPMWKVVEGPLSGLVDQLRDQALADGRITQYDTVIGDKIKTIFAKTPSFSQALERERAEFVDLCSRSFTQTRVQHMLEQGKPLRN